MNKINSTKALIILFLAITFSHIQAQNYVRDVDGNIYNTISIGGQVWMKENLRTTRYNNGDFIETTIPSDKDISVEYKPKYQWAYDGNEKFVRTFGRLYTWYVVSDERGICPTGWKVPSYEDWYNLNYYLIRNNYGYEGRKEDIAKALAASSGWEGFTATGSIGHNPWYNNTSNFSALPGGLKDNDGYFCLKGRFGYWWTSTSGDEWNAYHQSLYYHMNIPHTYTTIKALGLSIRCIKVTQEN